MKQHTRSKILLTMFCLLIVLTPVNASGVQVQYSTDNLTWENVTSTDQKINESYQINLQAGTEYYFRARDETDPYTYFTQRTKQGTEQVMGNLAVALFVLLSAGGFLVLPFIKERFSNNEFTNLIIRRGLWVIGLFLMMLNSAIMVEIASTTSLNLKNELFRYMWFYGWFGWLLLGFMVLRTLIDVIKMYNMKKMSLRSGDEE